MKIKVVSAIGGEVLDIDISRNARVSALKEEIARRKNIPVNIFVLAFRGRELSETKSIQDEGVQEEDRIYLITRTEGGFL